MKIRRTKNFKKNQYTFSASINRLQYQDLQNIRQSHKMNPEQRACFMLIQQSDSHSKLDQNFSNLFNETVQTKLQLKKNLKSQPYQQNFILMEQNTSWISKNDFNQKFPRKNVRSLMHNYSSKQRHKTLPLFCSSISMKDQNPVKQKIKTEDNQFYLLSQMKKTVLNPTQYMIFDSRKAFTINKNLNSQNNSGRSIYVKSLQDLVKKRIKEKKCKQKNNQKIFITKSYLSPKKSKKI